jgi:hypothetical protein
MPPGTQRHTHTVLNGLVAQHMLPPIYGTLLAGFVTADEHLLLLLSLP